MYFFSVLCRISLPVRTGSHPTERRPVIAAHLFHDELLYETLRIGYDLEHVRTLSQVLHVQPVFVAGERSLSDYSTLHIVNNSLAVCCRRQADHSIFLSRIRVELHAAFLHYDVFYTVGMGPLRIRPNDPFARQIFHPRPAHETLGRIDVYLRCVESIGR